MDIESACRYWSFRLPKCRRLYNHNLSDASGQVVSPGDNRLPAQLAKTRMTLAKPIIINDYILPNATKLVRSV